MPACVLPVTLDHLVRPVRETQPAQPVVGRAGRDRVGGTAGSDDLGEGRLPALLEPDAETGLHQPHVGPGQPADQDVADLVVDAVRPVHPALLHEHTLQTRRGGDGRDLPGVVGLDAADRHQRVGTLRERVGDQVFQLAGLVAAVCDAGVAVLPLRPDLGTAQMAGQPVQPVHRRRAEQQRVTGKAGDAHERPSVSG
jgi:hypothetical protein